MQTTYRLNANEIDESFIEKIKKLFKNKEVRINIEEVEPPTNQYEIFKKLEQLKKKYPPKVISPDIDIPALIKQVNDNEI